MPTWLGRLRPLQLKLSAKTNLHRRRLNVEALEDRRLLAVNITEFAVPSLAPEQPIGITGGPDGNLWFTLRAGGSTADQIGQVTPQGVFQLFDLPQGGSAPGDIVTGPDGALWFVQTATGLVGRTDVNGKTQEFPLNKGSGPQSIASGPGNAVTIADSALRQIVEMLTDGTIDLTATAPKGSPVGVTIAPDGSPWFTNPADNSIGTIAGDPVFREFPIPTPNSQPARIIVGPDGNLWFTEQGADQIGRIDAQGVITEFALPTPNSGPFEITSGPDGALWFTEPNVNQVGRITTTGQVTEFAVPTANSRPTGISAGSDGNIWFTEAAVNKVAKFDVRSLGLNASGIEVCAFAGAPSLNVPVASFTDTNREAQPANFSATIDWGDASAPTAGTISGGFGRFSVTGSHTYSIEGNLTVTVTVTRNDGAHAAVTPSAMVGGFITSLYQTVLERAPDTAGLNVWVGLLNAGVSRNALSTAFWTSTEHRGLEVDQFYQTFLNRAADPAGRAGWVNALLSGVSETQVSIDFLTSAEYTASHPTTDSYVTGLYTDIFDRSPDQPGFAAWVGVIQNGVRTRAAVAYYFLTSAESYVRAIDSYYEEFLGRSPSGDEVQNLFNTLVAGATPADITAIFLSSPEYIARQILLACGGTAAS
jgi:virginiamycin B lyase